MTKKAFEVLLLLTWKQKGIPFIWLKVVSHRAISTIQARSHGAGYYAAGHGWTRRNLQNLAKPVFKAELPVLVTGIKLSDLP